MNKRQKYINKQLLEIQPLILELVAATNNATAKKRLAQKARMIRHHLDEIDCANNPDNPWQPIFYGDGHKANDKYSKYSIKHRKA